MKQLLLILSTLLISYSALSTHIVGGSLTYEHLGGTTYSVKLKLYRDCRPVVTEPFPSSATITVLNGLGGNTTLSFVLPQMGVIELDPLIDSCAVDPGICVQESVYTRIVSLPPSQNGYHLYFSICCRNTSIINLIPNDGYSNGTGIGETFHTYIPNNNEWLTNSSPSWVNFPPVFVCQGQDVNFDHSATDSNGDSLVYSLYAPYNYNTPSINNIIPIPDNINFVPVIYSSAAFNANNPLGNAADPLKIDPQTGLITGTPSLIGQFVVGIKCEEYRNGVKIGVIVRDFQFNVVDCPPARKAGIGPISGCEGSTIQMINESAAGASDFQWDFGDASPKIIGDAPTHTFPGNGEYTITLIAQYGTVCADTATRKLLIGGVTAMMADLDSTCISSSVNLSDQSTVDASMVINSWKWDFGDGSPSSTVPNPSHAFTASGDLDVKLIVGTNAGCLDSITKPIYIQGLPIADAGPDTTACYNNPNISLHGIITNADGGIWVGNGGVFTPNTADMNAIYEPSQLEINTGYTELILSTTGNGFCPSTQTTLRIDFIDGPIINIGTDIEVCSDTSYIPLFATYQFSGGVEWYTVTGTGTFTDPLSPNTQYIPSPADIISGSVEIIAQTTINGNCFKDSDTLNITFFSPPTISLDFIDTVCANNPIYLDANSTTGNGIWSTSGDGNFLSDTANTTTYIHGPVDLVNGNVEIYFESLLNGGCQIQRDTIQISVLPSPIVDFSFTEVCYGSPTVFSNNVVSSDPITAYSWSTGGNIFSNLANPSFIIPNLNANEITFIAYSKNGCSDTITKTVSTFNIPNVDFNIPAPCLNGGSQFFDDSYVDGGAIESWNWSFGDSGSSNEENPIHNYDDTSNYEVQLIVTSNQGCIDSLTKTITIYPGPNADFTATPLSAHVFQNITFVDNSTSQHPIVFWEWNFNDGNYSNDQNTIHNYGNGGNYTVILTVQDENGCIDTAINEVNIYLPPNVPSGFSPNGDGNNDYLYVYGGPYETLDFRVYNNWGEVIFKTNDATVGWDGTYKGVEQPIGVYVWTVKATTSNGEKHDISGDTSLIK